MSVELDPAELGFKRPFTQEVSQILRLYNPGSNPVAFKVKTTAPKQYCVRPNSGRIEPKADVEVQVLLQAMKEDPPLDARCRDKFLVQSIAIDASNEFTNIQQVWQHIEQTAKSAIQEKKIRVTFLPADGSAANGVGHGDDSFARDSPTPAPRTPQRGVEASPSGPVSRPESRPEDNRHLGDAVASAHNPSTDRSTVGAAVASVTSAVPTSSDDLKAQLAEAKATIQKLQSQAQDSGLRQRKTEATAKDAKDRVTSGLGVQQAPAGGVPVQIVAGLCLLCFLIAYLFF
ncbi:Vesicle-associated membrane protein-associated protein [Sphaceloma murrayae]|uniref:Vesicle-associated membrane protein-associated protein n=1 Tax=Sphaceloma murrayae TaxID=2082308 RepID=A0A2K1QG33_9PEZI|nr:Vesicle-associated membrane protein-associated protein [Sphaceloma murrayae]